MYIKKTVIGKNSRVTETHVTGSKCQLGKNAYRYGENRRPANFKTVT